MTSEHVENRFSSVLRIGSILSIVLLIGVMSMWGRSYWVIDRYVCYSGDGSTTFKMRSEMGRLSYMRLIEKSRAVIKNPFLQTMDVMADVPVQTLLDESCRFDYEKLTGDPKKGGFDKLFVVVPYWPFALGCCVVPATLWELRRRRKISVRPVL